MLYSPWRGFCGAQGQGISFLQQGEEAPAALPVLFWARWREPWLQAEVSLVCPHPFCYKACNQLAQKSVHFHPRAQVLVFIIFLSFFLKHPTIKLRKRKCWLLHINNTGLWLNHKSEAFLKAWIKNWPMNLEGGRKGNHVIAQTCVYAHNCVSKSEWAWGCLSCHLSQMMGNWGKQKSEAWFSPYCTPMSVSKNRLKISCFHGFN